jgi:hypothetical protein
MAHVRAEVSMNVFRRNCLRESFDVRLFQADAWEQNNKIAIKKNPCDDFMV